MIRAVLSNPSHPEYGVVTIPLPISRAQYDDTLRELEELEIGAVARQIYRQNLRFLSVHSILFMIYFIWGDNVGARNAQGSANASLSRLD